MHMKEKTRTEWNLTKNMPRLAQQYRCFFDFQFAADQAGMTLFEAIEHLIKTRKGAIRGMAKFLKDFHQITPQTKSKAVEIERQKAKQREAEAAVESPKDKAAADQTQIITS